MGLSLRNIKINFIMFEFTYLINIYRNNNLYYLQNFSVTKSQFIVKVQSFYNKTFYFPLSLFLCLRKHSHF